MSNKKTNRLDTFNKEYQSASKMIPSWVSFTALAGTLLFALFAAALVSNQTEVVNAVGESDVSIDFLWRFLKTNMWCKIWLGLMLLCFLVVMACWMTPFIKGLIALIPVQKPVGTKTEGFLVDTALDERSEDQDHSTLNNDSLAMDVIVRHDREDGCIEVKETGIGGDLEEAKDEGQKDEKQTLGCPISIDTEAFRRLFSDDLSEEKFNALCSRMYEKASSYSKRNYGQLAHIIMFRSRYYSTDDKYIQIRQGNKTSCFSPYCQDFYAAIGLTPSSLDKGYYETMNTVVLDDFKDILDI